MNAKLSVDLKKLANSQVVASLTKYLGEYEKKAKGLVKEFDVRSREARNKSRTRLNDFVGQLKKTRGDVEKKVKTLLEEEGKRLNVRVNELLESLKAIAQPDAPKKTAQKGGKTAGAKTSKKKAGPRKTARKSASPVSVPLDSPANATTH